MLGEYGAMIKWAIIAALIGSVVYIIEDFGYNRAWNKHLNLEKTRMDEVNKTIKEEHEKYIQETAKSGAYADFIQGDYNAKLEQIKALKGDILGLTSDVSRMHQRTACRRSENRVSEGSNTSIPAESTGNDDTGFSPEFDDFLNSQAIRDEINVLWMDRVITYNNKLCSQSNVECQK